MKVLDKCFYWIYFLMKLSMIYLLLLLIGAVLLGFHPANTSMMSLMAKHQKDLDAYTFKEAFNIYKKDFWSSNAMGYLLGILAACIAYTIFHLPSVSSLALLFAIQVINSFFLNYLLCIYAVYLKLQVYYDFSFVNALKLSAMAVFFDMVAILKCLLGSFIVIFLLSKVSLLLAVFLPVIWLIFIADVLEPIYQMVKAGNHLR
ncbi:hypothetical protein AT575_07360 [Streptococcus penaeicida]|uniref:Beta-carotene 15,15'-monooxygenase n=2 Tax=Streptococcus penaeicida TaxID=1765960 RepID=A0A2N8LAZ3_9STRE|nr:hypothetical protein AT575_07360 [Streptococcus penaeicida]